MGVSTRTTRRRSTAPATWASPSSSPTSRATSSEDDRGRALLPARRTGWPRWTSRRAAHEAALPRAAGGAGAAAGDARRGVSRRARGSARRRCRSARAWAVLAAAGIYGDIGRKVAGARRACVGSPGVDGQAREARLDRAGRLGSGAAARPLSAHSARSGPMAPSACALPRRTPTHRAAIGSATARDLHP